MAAINDHAYLKICADIASCLSISLAAARRRVELLAAKQGLKDLQSRKEIAQQLLKEALTSAQEDVAPAAHLDGLLKALAEEENFMIED